MPRAPEVVHGELEQPRAASLRSSSSTPSPSIHCETRGSWRQPSPSHRKTPKSPTTRTMPDGWRCTTVAPRAVARMTTSRSEPAWRSKVTHSVGAVGVAHEPAGDPVGVAPGAAVGRVGDRAALDREPGLTRASLRVGRGGDDGAVAGHVALVDAGPDGVGDLLDGDLVPRLGAVEHRGPTPPAPRSGGAAGTGSGRARRPSAERLGTVSGIERGRWECRSAAGVDGRAGASPPRPRSRAPAGLAVGLALHRRRPLADLGDQQAEHGRRRRTMRAAKPRAQRAPLVTACRRAWLSVLAWSGVRPAGGCQLAPIASMPLTRRRR